MNMLRVNSSSVLIVPPFECAWLGGEDFHLKDEAGCLAFEVKSENDLTVIFKPTAGSKRWQEYVRGDGQLRPTVDSNYTVILGSHRNRILKVEKDGLPCDEASSWKQLITADTYFSSSVPDTAELHLTRSGK